MKKKLKEFMVEREQEQWIKDNPKMWQDAMKLCQDAVMFNMKWGIPLGVIIDEIFYDQAIKNETTS